jgi:hypothetical protein
MPDLSGDAAGGSPATSPVASAQLIVRRTAVTSWFKSLKATLVALAFGALMIAVLPSTSHAQYSFNDIYPDFFKIPDQGRLSTLGFLGGYGSDKYGTAQEGFQLEQSVTKYIGVFGRLTGYQLWIGGGFDSPLNPGSGHQARLNFGRAQGGLDFNLWPGTHFFISGGKDFGDSHATVIEGDLSSWFLLHSFHPINFSFSSIHDYQNGVTSTEVDIQAILLSREKYLIMAGGGGAFYMGGFVSGTDGQGGPDLSFYYRPWELGWSAQAGYGSAHQYGQLTMYKELDFTEPAFFHF